MGTSATQALSAGSATEGSATTGRATFTFAVAARATETAAEWDFRCRMLSATLRSLFAQTDGAFRVMVAGEPAPRIDFPTDSRFEFVSFKAAPTRDMDAAHFDQAAKLGAMAALVADRGGGYFMPVDMDDFVSRNLVAFVRANPDPNGYVVDSGYAYDGLTNMVAPLYDVGAPFGPLNKACGTCAIINLAPEDLCRGSFSKRYAPRLMRFGLAGGRQFRYLRLRAEGHYRMTEAADAERRPLKRIPFRAVVYTAFHGHNLSMLTDNPNSIKARRRLAEAIRVGGVPSSVLADEFSLPSVYPLLEDSGATAGAAS